VEMLGTKIFLNFQKKNAGVEWGWIDAQKKKLKKL